MHAPDLETFAASWVAAWNARDLEQILAHYADEVEFTSPRARQVVPASGGVVRGKAALRGYWERALEASPDLHFELEQSFETVGGASLLYRNHRGQRVIEAFFWDDRGLITRSSASYAPAPPGLELCVIARVPAAGAAAFERYEGAVLPLLPRHGGLLRERLRTADAACEIHLLRFRDEAALASYQADPERQAHAPDLAASGATIELLRVSPVR